MWLSLVKYSVREHSSLLRAFSRSSTTLRRSGSDVSTPISSLESNAIATVNAVLPVQLYGNLLLFWLDTILLRSYEIEQGFRAPV